MDYPVLGHYDPSVEATADSGGDEQELLWEETNYILPGDEYVPATEQFGEDFSGAEFHETRTLLADGGDRFGVSTATFDNVEELMWMGNQGGHVTSYYGSGLQKYTSFQVHATQEVRHIHPLDEGILVLTQSLLRCQLRRGIPIFSHTSSNMIDMQCMLQISPTRLLMGGHQEKIIDFNLTRGKETGLVHVGENGCAILRQHSRLICCGNPVGRIDLRDPNTLSIEHTFDTHSASLSDFDVQGNYLVTCGFSNSRQGLSVDRFLMAYDLRQMRALSPVTTLVYPLLLKFLPSYSSRLAVVSPLGQMQLLDTIYANVQPAMTCLYQVATGCAMILSFDVSSTSQCLCFGDSAGSIHLMSTNTPEPQFNTFSRPTEFADPVESIQSISFNDDVTPLSTIPIVYTGHPLLSDWPEEYLKKVYRKTPSIDPEILRTMKMQGTIGYAPNPQAFRRNQIPYNLEKRRGVVTKLFAGDSRSKTDDGTFVAIPKRYRKIEVKYSRLGYDEFDFDQYNRTSFCGLEATLPNSYCNAMLQLLYFCEPVRIALLSHSCQREFCLSCELGFLFHMLDTSRGLPCQAANFLRAFRTVPEAAALGLILSDLHPEAKRKTNLVRLIQSWNRFILHQIHYEVLETRKRQKEEEEAARLKSGPKCPPFVYNEQDFPSILQDIGSRYRSHAEERKKRRKQEGDGKYMWITSKDKNNKKSIEENEIRDEETEVSRLFGSEQMHIHCCLKCGQEATKHSIMLLCNLVYPELTHPSEEVPFTSVLARSLRPEKITPAWCDNCQKFTPTLQSRQLTKLPQILALNCGLDTQQDKSFWQQQMDIVVQKVLNGKESSPSSSPIPITVKPCRYGNNCTRIGCRFRHIGRDPETITTPPVTPPTTTSTPVSTAATPPSHLYYSHSWIPHNIEISLDSNGELFVEKISSSKNDSNESSKSTDDVIVENGQGDSKIQDSEISGNNSEDKMTENHVIAELDDDDMEKENKIDDNLNKISKIQYSLNAVVCYIDDKSNEDRRNIVALLRVGPNYHERSVGSAVSQWYIFNDFCISAVTPQEAVWFNLDWKVPCVLHYTAVPAPEPVPFVSPLTYDVFGEDKCIARSGGTRGITFTPLSSDEMPKKGELVGIDAEFVTLNQEEAELRSDGKMSTIKPSHMSVARITCIRGQGPLEGTPFIDDYISTQEQVVDYLTKFSGIQPGDLDANFSSKHLTTLKSTYQKLRFLVDNGIMFVGHGLKNDFRVINLVVPPEQIVDTVLLFHLPHHRMVSLRFLTWHFLGKKIQSETHDSTEDARAALELYRKYKELESSGKLSESLKELYKVGNQLQWKVPDS
ncbi:PAN2-PAN3 deadenylation complex catalytic subunit PAN2 isoform X1 [Apis laboriosa]|uniref:PAN2-PAN3 deadenylation complex catalytic subunit PAN2 isoform X1 n=1 Tax=Apis laboriosa TaxID=183418 RepID=UPI001CC3F43A|nr:PAN2-PAN3 deadenylation complex catalytic subunit PAN2 isoform X1 [Apis laboriosa]